MKSPFLNFKTAVVLCLATSAWWGFQGLVAYETERMVPMGKLSCSYSGVVVDGNHNDGVLTTFKCGEETVKLKPGDTLAVLTKNIKTIACSRSQGSRSGDVKWECELPVE